MRTPKDIKFLLTNTIKNDFTLDTDDKNAFIAESRSFRTDIPEANNTYVRYQNASYYVDQFLLNNGFVLITNNKDIYIVPKQKFLSFHKINDSLEALEKRQINSDRFDDDSTAILRVNMRNSKAFLQGLNGPFDTVFTLTMQETAKALAAGLYGTRLVYVAHDEITLILKRTSPNKNSAMVFNNKRQKIISLAATIASNTFNQTWLNHKDPDRQTILDDKAFKAQFLVTALTLPQYTEKAMEYLWWRVSCTSIKSIHQLARHLCPDQDLNHKGTRDILATLDTNKTPWKTSLNSHCKYGTLYYSSATKKWKTWTAFDGNLLDKLQQCRTVSDLKASPICDHLHYKS